MMTVTSRLSSRDQRHVTPGNSPQCILITHYYVFSGVQEFQRVWNNEKLVDAAAQFIGGDIAGHPVWNLRSKTPHTEQATVPWHQDNAYLSADCENTLQVTAWVPLVDANSTNGCIQVCVEYV